MLSAAIFTAFGDELEKIAFMPGQTIQMRSLMSGGLPSAAGAAKALPGVAKAAPPPLPARAATPPPLPARATQQAPGRGTPPPLPARAMGQQRDEGFGALMQGMRGSSSNPFSSMKLAMRRSLDALGA